MNNFDKILDFTKLFWQYPVITEKTFYDQNRYNKNYIGIPWATIIDKIKQKQKMLNIIKSACQPNIEYFTCCQHINFRLLIPFFKMMNVKTLYTPHKVKNQDNIDGIQIIACPLYAVNFEKYISQKNLDYANVKREYLYSFMGAYNPTCYLTKIRQDIFHMNHPENTKIINTGLWHFEKSVYSDLQNYKQDLDTSEKYTKNTEDYNNLLLNSRYSLCPSGSGPNSIRLWESLACGSIPIILSDTLDLPEHQLWKEAIIRVNESNIDNIHEILKNISEQREYEMRINCMKIYNHFCNNYMNKNIILHYCCDSYENGAIGGVARYDYHLKLAFPDRIFVKQKDPLLLKLCNLYKDKLIVITDNHLSCDIPNNIKTFLVHHDVAETHAIREPSWNKYWKELCCNGQKKMLFYRNPETTQIISISQFCTDEFEKIYGTNYTKFNIKKVLHCSEFNEQMYLKSFNDKPNILGNWSGFNKGEHLIYKLRSTYGRSCNFNKLNVLLDKNGIDSFNIRKQKEYLRNDMYLCLSLCEGFSYAVLDALLCGLVVISTNVGLCYKDVPQECFVMLDWTKINDLEYIKSKIDYGWKNREIISKNGRNWYMNNCRLDNWISNMKEVIK